MRCKGRRGRGSTTAAHVTRAVRAVRAAGAAGLSIVCRAEQVPPVTGDVDEDSDTAVGFRSRRAAELNAGGRHPVVDGIEVIDPEEEPDTVADLIAGRRGLPLAVRASEHDAGLAPGRPDDDPPFRPPVVGQRWRVFGQVEPEDAREELDGPVIVVDDDRDLVQQHAREPTSGSGAGRRARRLAEAGPFDGRGRDVSHLSLGLAGGLPGWVFVSEERVLTVGFRAAADRLAALPRSGWPGTLSRD